MTVGRAASTATNFSVGGGASSPATFSYTQPATNNNRALLLVVAGDHSSGSSLLTSITYAGTEMNSATKYQPATTYGSLDFRMLVNPTTGTNNVSLSWSTGPGAMCGGVWSLFDVDQTTCADNITGETIGDANSPTEYLARTSRSGDMAVYMCGYSNDFSPPIGAFQGTTVFLDSTVNNVGALGIGGTYKDSTAASVDVGMTFGGSERTCHIYANIRAAATNVVPPYARPYSPDANGMRTVLRM